jgi:quercetin dioxygenase-like cupin family protein
MTRSVNSRWVEHEMTDELVIAPPHTAPGEGTAVWHLGMLLTFKATGAGTAGRCWAKELLAPRGAATPLHVHSLEDEAFYVLDGEVSLHLGDEVLRAAAGTFAWGPRGLPHAFRVESETARMLVLGTPAGFERFFLDTGTATTSAGLPPAGGPPPALEVLVAAARRHGVEIIGPPPPP